MEGGLEMNSETRSRVLEPETPEKYTVFKAHLHPKPSCVASSKRFSSPGLSFHICKMGIIIPA